MDERNLPKYLKINEDESVTIDFSDRPATIDGTAVKSLTMREPTVDDQLIADKAANSRGEQEVILFASLTEQNPEAIRSLKLRQYTRLQDAYGVFTD